MLLRQPDELGDQSLKDQIMHGKVAPVGDITTIAILAILVVVALAVAILAIITK